MLALQPDRPDFQIGLDAATCGCARGRAAPLRDEGVALGVSSEVVDDLDLFFFGQSTEERFIRQIERELRILLRRSGRSPPGRPTHHQNGSLFAGAQEANPLTELSRESRCWIFLQRSSSARTL